MGKIYIIGIVASGKTTLARRLSNTWNIPHYEVDCIVHHRHNDEHYKRSTDEQIKIMEEIDRQGDWIIEGTYRESCDVLLELADRSIFLDTPLWIRKYRILLRYVKQQLGIEKCHYKSDWYMLKRMYKWTREFEKNREAFNKLLSAHHEKKLEIVKNAKQITNPIKAVYKNSITIK